MTWLTEDPTLWIAAGVVGAGVLAIWFLQSGRGIALIALAGLLAVVLGGVALEWAIVTPREEVAGVLEQTAAALEANDPEAVLDHIEPSAEMGTRIQDALRRFTIEEVRLSDLKVELQERTRPPTAIVKFMARVTVKDRSGQAPYDTAIRRFTVRLRRRDGQWRFESYQDHDFRGEY